MRFSWGKPAAIGGVAVAWPLFLWFNHWLFIALDYTAHSSWIFLPAAMRILGVLLFGWAGAVGLVLGAAYTMHWGPVLEIPHQVLLSASSGLAPLVAVMICRRLFGIADDLGGLRAVHIVALSIAGAAANSLLANGTLALAGEVRGDLMPLVVMFLGDLNGTAIVLFLVSTMLALVTPRLGAAGG